MTLVELTLIPMDKGSSFSGYVARVLDVIDSFGLEYVFPPMGTIVEGKWTVAQKLGRPLKIL